MLVHVQEEEDLLGTGRMLIIKGVYYGASQTWLNCRHAATRPM